MIGAGPYGLSTAAHLRARALRVRVFGAPMEDWAASMPRGSLLAEPPPACSLSATRPGFTLAAYCREAGEGALDERAPVPLDLFVRYGRWFARELVRKVEDVRVLSVDRHRDGFRLKLTSGEEARAAAVVVATETSCYPHLPEELGRAVPDGPSAHGPVAHSSQLTDPERFAGREVLVVGAGQSAQESAALLHEAGAQVRVVTRGPGLRQGRPPRQGARGAPPAEGSWALRAAVRRPAAFRLLPAATRLRLLGNAPRPHGAWWLRERVADIPVLTGHAVTGAAREDEGVTLTTATPDGASHRLTADHVLAATGYRMRLESLDFLSPELHAALDRVGGFPLLGRDLDSSVPGLYFTGYPAAATYGPALRLLHGTDFAAPRLAEAIRARQA
ncbi:NAD(P)-binding domain-containing protein [Streptomyces sp. ODS28]|uniref:NAD(P)-binding domain-containing protein n=1 Tax=Streptomyces sp. ODS28 TaxID=3136688 RepID=UPI0031E64067